MYRAPNSVYSQICRTLGRNRTSLQRPAQSRHQRTALNSTYSSVTTKSGVLGDHKISEIGVARGGFVRPEYEHRAALFGAVWTMLLASFDVKGRAGQVRLSFVDELAFRDIKRFRHPFMLVSWDCRAGLHYDVRHHRSKRVILVSDSEGDFPLTRERKPIRLDLRGGNFLIVHVVLLLLLFCLFRVRIELDCLIGWLRRRRSLRSERDSTARRNRSEASTHLASTSHLRIVAAAPGGDLES